MKGICPNCEKETELKFIRNKEEVNTRGELIEVDVEYYRCLSCGEEFEDPHSNNDPLDKAYREYRHRHGMLQPDLSLFSDSELKILASVREYFKDYTAGRITQFSHEEKGYKETTTGQLITYRYAEELKI